MLVQPQLILLDNAMTLRSCICVDLSVLEVQLVAAVQEAVTPGDPFLLDQALEAGQCAVERVEH